MLSNLTTTIKSWELLPGINTFFKNIISFFRYSMLWVKNMVVGGLSYVPIYCLYALTIFLVIPIIFFIFLRKIKSKKDTVTSMKFFVFLKKMVGK